MENKHRRNLLISLILFIAVAVLTVIIVKYMSPEIQNTQSMSETVAQEELVGGTIESISGDTVFIKTFLNKIGSPEQVVDVATTSTTLISVSLLRDGKIYKEGALKSPEMLAVEMLNRDKKIVSHGDTTSTALISGFELEEVGFSDLSKGEIITSIGKYVGPNKFDASVITITTHSVTNPIIPKTDYRVVEATTTKAVTSESQAKSPIPLAPQ